MTKLIHDAAGGSVSAVRSARLIGLGLVVYPLQKQPGGTADSLQKQMAKAFSRPLRCRATACEISWLLFIRHARGSGHPGRATETGALDSRFRGNDKKRERRWLSAKENPADPRERRGEGGDARRSLGRGRAERPP